MCSGLIFEVPNVSRKCSIVLVFFVVKLCFACNPSVSRDILLQLDIFFSYLI